MQQGCFRNKPTLVDNNKFSIEQKKFADLMVKLIIYTHNIGKARPEA